MAIGNANSDIHLFVVSRIGRRLKMVPVKTHTHTSHERVHTNAHSYTNTYTASLKVHGGDVQISLERDLSTAYLIRDVTCSKRQPAVKQDLDFGLSGRS